MFLFVAMLIFGGIAVDLMLYENRRTHVQNSTDRAVLAAANLKQTVDPKLVVIDYLAKVGVTVTEEDIDVQEVGEAPVVTGRQVSVRVNSQSDTLLMNMVGVDSLPYAAASEASESVNDVEVSLVLDISGSMGNPSTKLENMQAAAKDFVDGVLEGSDDDRVSISLIPYATQVSAGPAILSQLVTEHDHDFSHCVNFEEEDFSTTAIHRTRPKVDDEGNIVMDGSGNPIMEVVPLSQTASFDPFRGYRSGRTHYYPVCRDANYVDIMPWSNTAEDLKDQIDLFTANGNTSIDVAMKWATALLDPSMNPVLAAIQADGSDGVDVDVAFSERPRSHTYPDVLKFIVLMTDGINTTQYELKPESKEGMSDIYYDVSANDYLRRIEETPGNILWWDLTDRRYETWTPGDDDRQLSMLEMWDAMTVSWRAYRGFYLPTGAIDGTYSSNAYYSELYDHRVDIQARSNDPDDDTKDKRLSTICTQAKKKGIVVFTIGFEVTDQSADIMEACASSEHHFYRVNGQDIQYAFASIKNQINQLKLTQ
ncbi:MAG: VWA domain-containing protein [Silicimonas sp.]|nr:VWA domain-containing protein [Silicimonas sp.]